MASIVEPGAASVVSATATATNGDAVSNSVAATPVPLTAAPPTAAPPTAAPPTAAPPTAAPPAAASGAGNANGASACELDPSGPGVQGDMAVSDKLPTKKDIERIADLVVLAADGSSRPFKSLYSGEGVAQRVMVVFIRHFFCGNCQNYLRELTESINPDSLLSLSVPTFIAVVGCGSPELIPMYTETTNCPFPIYADPSKKIYDHLSMGRTLALGPKPDYQRKSVLANGLASAWQMLRSGKAGFKGGDYNQVGGELLFDKGEVTWCHRMRNTRDHTEVRELRRILGLGNSEASQKKPGRRSLDVIGLAGRKGAKDGEPPVEENGGLTPPKRRWSMTPEKMKNRLSGEWNGKPHASPKAARAAPESVEEDRDEVSTPATAKPITNGAVPVAVPEADETAPSQPAEGTVTAQSNVVQNEQRAGALTATPTPAAEEAAALPETHTETEAASNKVNGHANGDATTTRPAADTSPVTAGDKVADASGANGIVKDKNAAVPLSDTSATA
ncbi:MAG: hypothetical protein M1825_002706 [Sarcosagium campestre]|nr:MAG: hypothetical protein M1825_002706 [Sarcosagium campestre]